MRFIFLAVSLLLASCAPDGGGSNTAANSNTTPLSSAQDTLSPNAFILAPQTIQNSTFQVAIIFSEPVLGLALSDISVTGGNTSNFSGSGAAYTFDITPPAHSTADITIIIPANAAQDASGNPNLAASATTVQINTFVPSVIISAPQTVQSSSFPVSVSFSEPVTGLSLSDFIISGGTPNNFAGSNTSYTFNITPNTNSVSDVTIDLPANAAFNAGNNGNLIVPQKVVPIDTIIPSVYIAAPTSPQTGTFSIDIVFSEIVSGFTSSDVIITNGTGANLTAVSGSRYTLDVTPASGASTVSFDIAANTAVDSAGNANTPAPQALTPIDGSVPTVIITAPTSVQNNPFNVSVDFSKPITGLTLADFTIAGGSATAGSLQGSSTHYTFNIKPNSGSTSVTINLAANTVVDAASNPNTAATPAVTPVDTIAPTVTISSPSATQNSSFPVTVTFSEAVTGVSLPNFTIVGGNAFNFTGSGAIYTFDIKPTSNSSVPVTIDFAANTIFDAAGNGNAAATQAITPVDTISPSVSISAPSTVRSSLFQVTVTFTEPVTGLALTDFAIVGGTSSNLLPASGPSTTYTFDIEPTLNSSVSVTVALPANIAIDAAGNLNTLATQTVTPIDTIPPTVTLAPPTGIQSGIFYVNVSFSEPVVVGLAASNFTVSNGSASNLTGSGTAYTLKITPTTNSNIPVTIDLPAGSTTDVAGNDNTEALQLSVAINTLNPSVTITPPLGVQNKKFTVPLQFSKPVTGLSLAGIQVTGGSTNNLVGTGTNYTFDIAPATNSTANITIDVLANAAFAGVSGNSASIQAVVAVDTVAPSITSIVVPTGVQTSTFPVTVHYSEDVYSVALSDFVVTGGTTSNFAVISPSSYTFDIIPATNSSTAVTIDINANTATDAAGNGNSAATQASVSIDTVLPLATLSISPSGIQTGAFTVTASFNENVLGVAQADFIVSGGTISAFAAGSGSSYSFTVNPPINATANITIDLPANVANDLAGNLNTASAQAVVNIDTLPPSPTISTAGGTQSSLFTVNTTFSEDVSGVALSDFMVTGGTVSNFIAVSPSSYTFDITPAVLSTTSITIDFPVNAATDLAGNNNLAATQKVVLVDTVSTSVSIAVPSTVQTGVFPVTATASQALTGLTLADFNIVGGIGSNFIPVSSTVYTFDVTPAANSTASITIELPANVALDGAGNGNGASSQAVTPVDTVVPSLTLIVPSTIQTTTFPVTAAFSEAVTGVTLSDFVVSAGNIAGNFAVVNPYTYTFDVTPASNAAGNITIDAPSGIAFDLASNANTAAIQAVVAANTSIPSVTMSAPTTKQNNLFTVNVVFSESVTGLALSNFVVTGGVSSNLLGSGTTYSFDVTPNPSTNTPVFINLPANSAQNSAGTGNSAATQISIAIDTVIPTASIAAPAGPLNSLFSVTTTFSENITGLAATDFVISSGATLSSFLSVNPSTYTFDITPAANSTTSITIDLPANSAFDVGNNGNIAAAQATTVIDTLSPSVSLALAPPTSGIQTGPFNISVSFPEPVTGLTLADFTVSGGTATTLTGSSSAYTLSITPNANSSTSVTVDLPAAVVTDSVGNSNTPATQAVIGIDTIVPGVSISAPLTTQTGAFVANVTFTEAIAGITVADFIITGGTASSFTGSGTAFTLNITPLANSTTDVTIKLPAEIATDAAGNPNTASSLVTVPIDTVVPTVAISAPTALQKATFPITVSYSEDVYSVALADFVVTGGTAANFAVVNPYTYTFDMIPASNSVANVTVDIYANTANDPAGNGNVAATQAIIPIDTIVPDVAITPPAGTQIGTFPISITFTETVTGLAAVDFSITGASASNLVGSGASYTLDITPDANFTGNINIILPPSNAFDAAGNGNTTSASIVVAADVQLPTAILSVPASPAIKTGAFTVTAIFSEAVSGISLASFTVSGGATSNFLNTVSNTYTFDITPPLNSSTTINVDLNANAVTDLAGNGNVAASPLVVPIDTVAPTITINPPAGTQTGLFTVNVSLSEALTGLTLADFNVLGGIASNFVGAGTSYTFDITPNANSTANVTIDVAAGAATDVAGNGNVAAVQSVVAVDTVLPTVTITPASGVQTGVFNVSVSFSENVTGFISSDISVAGGTLSNFTALSALSYTFDVTPPLNSTTNAVIDILANAAFDAAGNGNTVAVQAVVPIDTVSPTVSITAPTTTQAATFPITITFSEVMTGLLASDFVLTNGSAANLAGSGTTYTLDITPTTNISGNITIDLPANAAFDLASNGNLAATQKAVPIDTVAPIVSFSVPTVPAVKSNPFTLTATFTKNVTGLTLADFVVTGGTTSNFAVVNGTYRYKFDITPAAFSTTSITVDLPANAAADSFGNGNAASSQLVVPVDTEAPIISVPVNPYAFDVLEEATFNFNITATDTSAITYSLYNNIQPTNGTVTVNSSTGAVSYQGNLNYSTYPYGPDTFNVAVSDAYGSTSLLEVRPNVINVNDPPTVGPNYATGLTMNEDTTTVVDLYSFDPDTNTIYIGYILESVPPASLGLLERLGVPLLAGSTFGELDLLVNRIKFAPAQDAFGTSSFSFRLRDNVSPYAPPYPSPAYVYPITVLAQNDTPVIETNSTLFINQNDPATALTTAVLSASDVDNTNAQLTYTVTTLPNQGTLNLTTFTQDDIINGLVTYTPNAAITGTDSFAFSLTDNVIAAPITGTFNISITPPQAAITASSSKASGALVGSNVNIVGEVKDLYTNTPFANKLVRFTIQTSPYATFVANGLQTIDVQTDVNGLATAALTDNYAETMPILVDAVNLGISQTLNQTFASNTGIGTVIASSPCTTTWGIAGSPYYIQSNISIASGCTLQIDPSVIVKFAANTQMVVASGGTLNVLGQSGGEVIFTSRNDDTVGGVAAPYSTGTAAAGDWRYLEYSNGALGSISYAQIRYAGASGFAALRPYAAITIDNVSISDSAGNGIGIIDGSPQVSNIHILNVAQKGIAISDYSSPTFTGINTIAGIGSTQAAIWLSGNLVQASFDGFSITGGQYNLHILSGAKATFTNNTFSGAVSEAVHLDNAGAAVSINSSNTISNTPAPYLMAQAFSPSDIYASLDAATVSDIYSVHLGGLFTRSVDTLVADPLGTGNSVYRVVADVQVEPNAILQIDPYTIIKFDNGKQLRAGLYYALSRIDILGGVGAPVIFTSVHDNSVGAALPGSTGSPTPGIWAGIRYNSALSSSIIQNAEIRYATTGLYVVNSSPSIENLSVTQFSDAGVHLRSTSGQTTSPNVTNLVLSTTDTSNRALYLQGTSGIVAPNINGTSITTASTSSVYGAIHLDGIAVNPSISSMTINGGYYGLYAINDASGTFTNNTFSNQTHNIRLEGSGTHTFTGNTFDGATSESVSLWNITPSNVSIDSSNTISNALAPYLITGAFIPANTAATVDAATVTNSSSISLAGSIKTNAVLTADPLNTGSSVYRITGSIYINSGARLQIDPYTVLKFNNNVGLYTNNGGVLDIYGAAGAPAIFTSIHDDSVGAILVGSTGAPIPGLWNSVDFQSGSTGSIRYADIRYAKWGVFANNSSPNIESLTVTEFSDYGLWLRSYSGETTSPNVTNLVLSTTDTSNYPLYLRDRNNDGGVVAPNINGTSITTASTSSYYGAIHLDGIGVNPSISNITINGGYYGLYAINDASGTFSNNTFTANTHNIWLEGSGSFAFTGNAFDGATGEAIALINNTAGNISIDSSNNMTNANAIYLAAGGFVPADTNPSIDIATTTDIYSVRLKGYFKNANGVLPADPLNTGSSVYLVTGNIDVRNGARLQIDPYTVLKFNNGVGLSTNNGGVLDIYGAAGAPAIFTSIHDDSVGAILLGSNGAPTPGRWSGIYYESGASGSISNANIHYTNTAMYIQNSSPNIENLTATEFSDSGLTLLSYLGQTTSPNVTNLVLSTTDTANYALYLLDNNNNGGVVAPNINGTSITTASTSSAYGAIHLSGIGVNPSISNMTINGGYYGLRVLNNASGTYVNNTFANQQHNIRPEGSGTHTFTNNTFDTATGEAIVFVNTTGGNITIDTSNTVSNAASPYVLVNQTVLPPAAQPQVASNVSDRYSLRVYGVLPASPYTYAFVADPLGTGDGTPSNPYTSVYHVVQNLTSNAGATITMDPYTIVKMDAYRSITFNGQVDIYGTPSMPVYFTSIKDDTLAGDTNGDNNATSPAPGNWDKVTWATADASSSVINNLETRYLYRARINGASPTFNNLSVLESSNIGIYIGDASAGSTTSPTLNNTIINGTNNEGVYISGASNQTTAPVLNGGKISNTSGAGAIALRYAGVNATISNMDISQPNKPAINIFLGAQATIENNTLHHSKTGVAAPALGYAAAGQVIVRNNTITANTVGIRSLTDAATTTIEHNIISSNANAGITVGSLATSPTVVRNNLIVNNDSAADAAIRIDTAAYATIEGNTITENTTSSVSPTASPGLWVNSGAFVTMTDNIIAQNINGSGAVRDVYSFSTLTESYNITTDTLLAGVGDIYADPLFTQNWYLQTTSPAIDAGSIVIENVTYLTSNPYAEAGQADLTTTMRDLGYHHAILPKTVSTLNSTVTADTLTPGLSGTSLITITPQDAIPTLLGSGMRVTANVVSAGAEVGSIASIRDQGDGTYVLTFNTTAVTGGNDTITISVNGVALPNTINITW